MTKEEAIEIHSHYIAHPEKFVSEILGIRLWSGMKMVIDAVWNNKRTSVRACHGISKTITAAAVAVTFLNLYEDAVVITTAPTHRQVEALLWKEIRAIYAKKGKHLRGRCLQTDIKTSQDSYMIGFATDQPVSLEGFHAPHILWILDEAKGLPQWVYDAVEGSFTGGFVRVLELSTTDGAEQQGPFRQHHTRGRDVWKCIQFSAFDSPFVGPDEFPEYSSKRNMDLYDFGKPLDKPEWPVDLTTEIQITSQEDILEKERDWKEKRTDLWVTKVFGEFSLSSEDNVIPLDWVMSAVNASVVQTDYEESYGLDIARMGSDRCVLTSKIGKEFQPQECWGKRKFPYSAGRVLKSCDRESVIKADINGLGVGLFDILAASGQAIIGLDSASKAYNEKAFVNLRAEAWWAAREMFERQYEEGNVCSIPDDPELIEDLTGIKYTYKLDGRIIIEPKEKYKLRLGRSPDKGDSFVYNVYNPIEVAEEFLGEADEENDIYV